MPLIYANSEKENVVGLEFVWDDGSHIYPNEYPENYTEIVVQGVFETYREAGDPNMYYRLKDATLEVADN